MNTHSVIHIHTNEYIVTHIHVYLYLCEQSMHMTLIQSPTHTHASTHTHTKHACMHSHTLKTHNTHTPTQAMWPTWSSPGLDTEAGPEQCPAGFAGSGPASPPLS